MPINMFLSKSGGSLGYEELKEIYKDYPPATGFEGDYDKVELDEQVDEFAGFPRALKD